MSLKVKVALFMLVVGSVGSICLTLGILVYCDSANLVPIIRDLAAGMGLAGATLIAAAFVLTRLLPHLPGEPAPQNAAAGETSRPA